jgi:hypothetical protein
MSQRTTWSSTENFCGEGSMNFEVREKACASSGTVKWALVFRKLRTNNSV